MNKKIDKIFENEEKSLKNKSKVVDELDETYMNIEDKVLSVQKIKDEKDMRR